MYHTWFWHPNVALNSFLDTWVELAVKYAYDGDFSQFIPGYL